MALEVRGCSGDAVYFTSTNMAMHSPVAFEIEVLRIYCNTSSKEAFSVVMHFERRRRSWMLVIQ